MKKLFFITLLCSLNTCFSESLTTFLKTERDKSEREFKKNMTRAETWEELRKKKPSYGIDAIVYIVATGREPVYQKSYVGENGTLAIRRDKHTMLAEFFLIRKKKLNDLIDQIHSNSIETPIALKQLLINEENYFKEACSLFFTLKRAKIEYYENKEEKPEEAKKILSYQKELETIVRSFISTQELINEILSNLL